MPEGNGNKDASRFQVYDVVLLAVAATLMALALLWALIID